MAYMYKNFLFYMSLIFSVLKSVLTNLQKWDLLHTITGENQTSVITQANNILILKCWQTEIVSKFCRNHQVLQRETQDRIDRLSNHLITMYYDIIHYESHWNCSETHYKNRFWFRQDSLYIQWKIKDGCTYFKLITKHKSLPL